MKKLLVKIRKNAHIFYSILISGNSAAYYALWIKFLQIACTPLDIFLRFIEKSTLKKRSTPRLPVIFVVGIHRTGSTYIAQVLSEAFDVMPIGNFATVFPRSRYIVHRLFKGLYKRKQQKGYKNFYGISKGLFTIGDAYEVWDQWFGKDHYNVPVQIDGQTKEDVADYFSQMVRAYEKPILTKNNRNLLAIEFFYRTVPNAFFIVVERDAVEVVQSTIKASKDFFGDSTYLWGVKPHRSFALNGHTDLTEAACRQHIALEEVIRSQLNKIPDNKYIEVRYSEFCADPQSHEQKIAHRLSETFNLQLNDVRYHTAPFKRSKRWQDSTQGIEIKKILSQLREQQHINV